MSDDNDRIEQLILNGALEVAGMSLETGEPLYSFTDKLASVDKGLFDAMNNYFYREVTDLWEKGFLNIDFFQESPIVELTDKAFDDIEVAQIDEDQQHALKEIRRIIDET